ncbi:MAG: tRNA (adenosine(37)-N6)-threonylcarbamoyltransferase complex dimerization subunit type 1 TsaB [Pseudomonadota bacterium]
MKILAFDTAARACSAALLEDGRVLAERLREMERGQAEALIGMIESVLEEGGVPFAELDRLATTVGPGSFTGLRVGLAAVRAFALAGSLPTVGVTTFEAVAAAVPAPERRGRRVLVALDTKRGDLYAQFFDAALEPLGPGAVLSPEACLPEDAGLPLLVVGDGARLLRPLFERWPGDVRWSVVPGYPQAAVIGRLAASRAPTIDMRPVYLRPPEARWPDA